MHGQHYDDEKKGAKSTSSRQILHFNHFLSAVSALQAQYWSRKQDKLRERKEGKKRTLKMIEQKQTEWKRQQIEDSEEREIASTMAKLQIKCKFIQILVG